LISDLILKSLIDRSFELMCPVMRLCQTPAYTLTVFEGHGRIWIDHYGQMRFQMIAETKNLSLEREWIPRLRVFGTTPQAMSVRENEYLQLRAYDLEGNEWSTNWMIPSIDFRGRHIVLWGPISSITTFRKLQNKKEEQFATFAIAKPPRIPFALQSVTSKEQDGEIVEKGWTTNRQIVSLDEMTVHFENLDDSLLIGDIRGRDGKPLLNQVAMPVVEALRYITSTIVRPIYYKQSRANGSVIHIDGNVAPAKWESDLLPPLIAKSREDYEKQWDIFKAYLQYLVQGLDGVAPFHPISTEYDAVMFASKHSLEGFALSLCIAVEAMLKICQNAFGDFDSFLVKQFPGKERLFKYISDWETNGKKDEILKNRAKSMAGSFKTGTVLDKLRYMKQNGWVRQEEITAWEKIRHPGAHGGAYQETDRREVARRIPIVSGLLHRIVLLEVGYKGVFTDYLNDDWPLVTLAKLEKEICSTQDNPNN